MTELEINESFKGRPPQSTVADLPPEDGRDWNCQCARCGSSVTTTQCEHCGGEGYHEVYEEDPINNDPDDREPCDTCEGRGFFRHCLSDEAFCKEHPIPGREDTDRGQIEWYTFDPAREPSAEAHKDGA